MDVTILSCFFFPFRIILCLRYNSRKEKSRLVDMEKKLIDRVVLHDAILDYNLCLYILNHTLNLGLIKIYFIMR